MSVQTSPAAPHACADGGRAVHAGGDVYCRMCGARLLSCAAALPAGGEIVCIVDAKTATAFQTIRLSAAGSVYPVPVRVEPGHAALHVSGLGRGGAEAVMEPGSSAVLEVRADAAGIAEPPDHVDTELRVLFPGTKLAPLSVPVRLGRRPSIEAEPVDLGTVKRGGVVRGTMRLRHDGGITTRLIDASARGPFVLAGADPGHRMGAGDRHDISVALEADDAIGTGDQTGEALLKWDSGARTRIPLRATIVPSAELTLTAKGPTEVPHGLASDLWLVLRNDSSFDVTVTELRVAGDPAWFRLERPSFPLLIPSEQKKQLPCRIDASSMPLGTYVVDVSARIEEGPAARYQISGRVVPLQPYVHAVAIDFGTTSSCVSYWSEKGIQLVPFMNPVSGTPDTVVPSLAFYDRRTERWLAGFEAVEAAERAGRPELLVRSVKRLLNRSRRESTAEGGRLELGGQFVAPETIVAEILRYLKRQTEQHLRAELDTVVLSLPANFTDTAVRALLRAARAAGLKPFLSDERNVWETHRIDEPTAAAIDIAQTRTGSEADREEERIAVVFDFGGGTLDVSVLLMSLVERERRVEVLAHKGANGLGGDEFTKAVVGLLVADFHGAFPGLPLQHDIRALKSSGAWDHNLDDIEKEEAFFNAHVLWEAAEAAKIKLTSEEQATAQVTVHVNRKDRTFTSTITRAAFNKAIADLVRRAADIIERAVASCRRRAIQLSGIDEVIVTGRASLVPLVLEAVKHRTNLTPTVPSQSSGAKECVARGACWYALEAIKKGRGAGGRSLVLGGIHEYTNSSYGFDVMVAEGFKAQYVFVPVIPEGIELRRSSGPQTFKKMVARVNESGNAQITIYQHAGDPSQDAIEGNPEIVPIDTIDVRGVRMPDPRNPPSVEVEMWIAADGLLDAVARVDGHDRAFPLESRYHV